MWSTYDNKAIGLLSDPNYGYWMKKVHLLLSESL